MSELEIGQIGDGRYLLGEGPLWDGRDGVLYWVDVLKKTIWRHTPGTDEFRRWELPDEVSSMALRENGGAVVTLADGFYTFDFDSGECALIGDAIDAEATRFNDGKVDRVGRFIAGTMDRVIGQPLGSLYSLSKDGVVSKKVSDIICTNGPCWSLDGTTFYFSDTMTKSIFSFDYDLDDGAMTNRRVFANYEQLGLEGVPDGCTVDSEGCLWSAQCLTGSIVRITPDGVVDRVIKMPVEYVTSVMFGGEKLDTLYVTSLNHALMGKEPQEPNSGGLFAVSGLGVTGVPEPRYAG